METEVIGAIAAMPQEIAPLLKRIGRYRSERAAGITLYRFTCGNTPVVLALSGMGPRHAREATRALIETARPAAILNFGFAGAVLPGLRVGELVLAERVYRLSDGVLEQAPRLALPQTSLAFEACRAAGLEVRSGSFITASGIMNKSDLAASVKAELALPVLEMETAAVLEEATAAGVPALALRAISDAAEEELGFSIEEICDAHLNLSPGRLMLALVKKPYLVPQLVRLAGNSRRAGMKLAQGVELTLRALGKGMAV